MDLLNSLKAKGASIETNALSLLKPITSDHDLIKLAKLIGIKLDSIVQLSEADKRLGKGTHIILLRMSEGGVGKASKKPSSPTDIGKASKKPSSPTDIGHWVCTHNGEYFDSTGIGPPTRIGNLPFNEFQYQSTYADYCGIYCMLWIYSKQKNRPELLNGFTNLDIDIL